MKIILIAAISQNNVIGRRGIIPWHSKSELSHFKNTTDGSPVIMGRKTWESLKAPLPNRVNIILSRNQELNYPDQELKIFHSLEESLLYCERENFQKCFIIGGGQIFKVGIDLADEMILSKMKFESEGDVLFPEINMEKWELKSEEDFEEYMIHTYIRKEK